MNQKQLLSNTASTNIPPVTLQAIIDVLEAEGGYVNNPNDNGGETNFGIAKRWYPHLDIKNLTITQAVDIYYQDYWLKNKCHLLPLPIATMLFDTAVNQGGSFARKSLQKVVGVKQDGFIGSQTIAAASLSNNSLQLVEYAQCRTKRYTHLIKKQPSQIDFLIGWMARVFGVLSRSLLLMTEGKLMIKIAKSTKARKRYIEGRQARLRAEVLLSKSSNIMSFKDVT